MNGPDEVGKFFKGLSEYSKISTDTINGITHNFIRKAKIKCEVKNILQSLKEIEDLTKSVGGYVTTSDLISHKDLITSVLFKKDSTMELSKQTATGNISLRVPNKQLDSLLSKIIDMAEFIDNRIITSDDVKLKLYAQKLTENRLRKSVKVREGKINASNANIKNHIKIADDVLEKQMLADNKKVESYELIDQINYSIVDLVIYESPKTVSLVKSLPPQIIPYEPTFLTKLVQAFENGFKVLKNIILFFINLWSVFLVLFILFIGIKKLIRKYNRSPI